MDQTTASACAAAMMRAFRHITACSLLGMQATFRPMSSMMPKQCRGIAP